MYPRPARKSQPRNSKFLEILRLEDRSVPAVVTFDVSGNPGKLLLDLDSTGEILSIQSIGSNNVRYTTTGSFTGDVPVQGVTSLDLNVAPGFPVVVTITDSATITGAVVSFLDSGANAYPTTPTTVTLDNNSSGVQFQGTTDFGANALSITADTTVSAKLNAVIQTTTNLLLAGDRLDLQTGATVNAGSATVTIRPATAGQEINIGGADFSGFLGLTDDELSRITAGFVQIGSSAAGNAKITSPINPHEHNEIINHHGWEVVSRSDLPRWDCDHHRIIGNFREFWHRKFIDSRKHCRIQS